MMNTNFNHNPSPSLISEMIDRARNNVKRIVPLFVVMFCIPVMLQATEPIAPPFKAIVLPEGMKHPDGMTVNPATGDIILACPVVGDKGNAWLLRIDANDNVSKYFELPAHPETGRVTPLGISFGPDGNLYISDSQCLGGNPNHKSRILRVVHQNGRPVRCEVVVTGIVQANGLEIHNGKIYVAETQIDPAIVEMPMTSGVFCFEISELKGSTPLHVLPYGRDPRFIFSFKTADKERQGEWKVGANGIGLTKDGTLYVANFGDNKVIEVKLDASGKKAVSHRDCNDGKGPHESVDGLKICPKGYIYFADFVGNTVCVMNPKNGKTILLAKNALNPNAAQKTGGALDRCSEVCLRGNKLYVANIDLESPVAPHTISVINLEGVNLDALLR